MNILLVDDDIDVLEGIMDGVDFAAIGIDEILTAVSAVQAWDILRSRDIDIMLTDIEMPGESGLDLLHWVRDSGYDVVTLFCTSYADFNYAKKAVEMHSFDYFLKPISYTALQDRLSAAVQECLKNKSIRNYKKHSEFWLSSQKENKRIFWINLLFSSSTLSEVLSTGKQSGLDYEPGDLCSLCLLTLSDDEPMLAPWKIYGFRNIAEEILSNNGVTPDAMIPTADGSWLLIFRQPDGFNAGRFTAVFHELIRCANKYLEADLNCCYTTGHTLEDSRDKYELIKRAATNDVIQVNCVYDADTYVFKKLPYTPKHLHEWELLLSARKEDELIRSIDAYLDCLAFRGELNYDFLRALRLDIIQMVYIELSKQGINAHKLFVSEPYDALLGRSLTSLKKFKQYLHYVFPLALDYMRFTSESQSVIGQVKEYITAHLGEEINRSTIAQQVFLNPDYLARLFKKETGQSIGAYLQDCRMQQAKKLLVQTSIQVNEIAQEVGYDNFSYFSHVFREKTGMTPNEYRKQNKK